MGRWDTMADEFLEAVKKLDEFAAKVLANAARMAKKPAFPLEYLPAAKPAERSPESHSLPVHLL